jgi:N-methylhydantoinase B/oxoprolinase/acetone carboxylase alpha subunit
MTYPFRVTEYAVRRGSGGPGLHQGGAGITRTYEFLSEATVTLLTERRRLAPWGLNGGAPGTPGRNHISRPSTGNVADGFSLPQHGGAAGQIDVADGFSLPRDTGAPGQIDVADGFSLPRDGRAAEQIDVADGFSLPQDGGVAGQEQELPSKTSFRVHPGDRLTIETPGGGGWGNP